MTSNETHEKSVAFSNSSKPRNQAFDNIIDVLCGSAAGSAGKVIEYPFDTVKVRLQSQPDHLPPRFDGPFDCFKQTFRREGMIGLYRGILSPIIGAALETSSLFFSYNTAKSFLGNHWYTSTNDLEKSASGSEPELPFHALILCGSFSGIVTSFLLTPIELVKCRMQVQMLYPVSTSSSSSPSRPSSSIQTAPISVRKLHIKSAVSSIAAKPPGLLNLIFDVYRKEGIAAFWRGQTATLLREAGGSAAWFGSYEYIKAYFRKVNNRDKNTIWENMLGGAWAGVMFNLSLFPADTIKSRMQTDALVNSSHSNTSGQATGQSGFWETGKNIYKSSGIKGLYRGCGVTVLRAAPSSAIIFVTYEKMKEAAYKLI